jgi:hypothetical protein
MNTAAAFGIAVLLLAQQTVGAPGAGATVRGHVFDADGRPMAGVSVRPASVDPEIRFVAGSSTATTSDGGFVITGLPPGSILVVAHPQMGAARRTPHPPVYFPGVLARTDAWPVDVARGETIELDIHVPPIFVASIQAVVSGPEGYVPDQLRVMRPEANEIRNVTVAENGVELDPLSTDQAEAGADGTFTIDGLFGNRMFRLLGLPAEWEVTAVRADRSDVTLTGTHLNPGSTTELTIVVSKK